MSDRAPLVVTVTGYRDSGTTTAIEMIVRWMRTAGYDVATIKHCHDGYDLDRPGTDSWRHRDAGACGTALMGPGGVAVLKNTPGEAPVAVARWAFSSAHLVLAEGFHWLPLPRIEIIDHDPDRHAGLAARAGRAIGDGMAAAKTGMRQQLEQFRRVAAGQFGDDLAFHPVRQIGAGHLCGDQEWNRETAAKDAHVG